MYIYKILLQSSIIYVYPQYAYVYIDRQIDIDIDIFVHICISLSVYISLSLFFSLPLSLPFSLSLSLSIYIIYIYIYIYMYVFLEPTFSFHINTYSGEVNPQFSKILRIQKENNTVSGKIFYSFKKRSIMSFNKLAQQFV